MDILLRILLITGLFFSPMALSGIQPDKTRVIYPAEKKEVTFGITNNASSPRLIQAWIDDGDTDYQATARSFPFLVVPPIFRIDPERGQKLRVRFIGPSLPGDRESVFWINLLELQPKPAGKLSATQNNVQFSTHMHLKLFYRPEKLAGRPQDAVQTLRWRLVTLKGGYALACENPSAWNVSFNGIHLPGRENPQDGSLRGMCPAKGEKTFPAPFIAHAGAGKMVVTTINDYGGFEQYETSYSL
ncbi:fimbria/pilus periplasmic chaperone [Phytobacter ursingii]|uniref:fimbrial biogenesis chaperone n=1 Tax=Phytobacter ursingii TaxID=1972431 RepID=UPI00269B91DA